MNSSSPPKILNLGSQHAHRLPNYIGTFFEWVSSVMVWLSQTATAAPLFVCFLLVLHPPHGQNMALAFIRTEFLKSIAMSASVELIICFHFVSYKSSTQSFISFICFCQHKRTGKQLLDKSCSRFDIQDILLSEISVCE